MIALLLPALFIGAGSHVSIRAEASSDRVAVDEAFTLSVTVTVEGQGDNVQYTPPDFDNLDVVRTGTQRGQHFVMNFGSAPKTQSTATYTYILRAKRPGKARIGPSSVRLGNELQSTEAITIAVDSGAGGGGGAAAQPPSRPGPQAMPAPGARADAVMLRVVPDKFEAYVGEQIVLSVFLLARIELTDIQSLTQPQLEGVLLERDDRPRTNLTPRIQRFGGEEYQVFEIQRYALFALRDGKVNVGAFALEAQGGGFGFFSQGRTYRVASEPIELVAKPLPNTGRPPGFSPMNVGQIQFTAQLLSGPMQVGKPLSLRIVATGVGNPSKLSLPSPRFGAKLKAYDPETKSEQRFDQGQLVGKIQRDYLFVPLEPGEHIIPPLVFHAFDPQAGEYRSQSSQAFAIRVGGESAAAPVTPGVQADKDEQKRLHPIRPFSMLRDDRPGMATWVLVWAGAGSSALSALGIAFGRLRRRERTPQDIARAARAKADKGLRAALAKGDPRDAYAEMHRVARLYLHERFGVSTGTGRDRLQSSLVDLGAKPEHVESLLVELDNCDFARFAPGGHLAKEAQLTKDRIQSVILELDKTKGAR